MIRSPGCDGNKPLLPGGGREGEVLHKRKLRERNSLQVQSSEKTFLTPNTALNYSLKRI